eukprot:4645307-Ditylum_brightwellii.AAC.1
MVYVYDNNWYKHPIQQYTRNILEFLRKGTLTNIPRHLLPVTNVIPAVYSLYLRCTRPAAVEQSNQPTNQQLCNLQRVYSIATSMGKDTTATLVLYRWRGKRWIQDRLKGMQHKWNHYKLRV